MRKNFKKALFSIFTAILVLSMTTTSFAAVVNYGSEYTNQPNKQYSQKFYDVDKNYWAFNYIAEMSERGAINGYPDGNYYPENYVTRAEFAKIMCIAAGLSIDDYDSTNYCDVHYYDWYTPYVSIGQYYLNGYVIDGELYYCPDQYALREDIAVALVKLKGYSITGADESILKTMFTDWQSISADARGYVAAAVENGLISGYEDRTFRGQDSINRAEAATLLWRAYQYGNENKKFGSVSYDDDDYDDDYYDDKNQTVKNDDKTQKDDSKNTTDKDDKKKDKEPEEEKAAYVCDTLVDADVDRYFANTSFDNNKTVYYYDSTDEVVYSLSLDNGKRNVVMDINNVRYDDIEIIETEVEKQVPKTVTKTVEKEENDDAENKDENAAKTDESINSEVDTLNDSADETSADNDENIDNTEKTSTTEVTETIYETVIEKVTEENKKGTYKNFSFSGLYYNTGNDRLYVFGTFYGYEADNLLNDKNVNYSGCFIIKNKKREFVELSNSITVIGNFPDGRMIADVYIKERGSYLEIITEECEERQKIDKSSGNVVYLDSFNNIAFVSGNDIYNLKCPSIECGATFAKYKFSSGWERLNSERGDYIGVCNNEVYRWDFQKNKFSKCDISGKISYIEEIDTKDGLDVIDFKSMPTSSSNKKMFISKKYGFTFYDSNNKCWRYIRKQK